MNTGASTGMPPPLTALIGREPDLARLQALLGAGGKRLVTLSGPGGIGKTRLARALLERSRAAGGPPGIFCDLSAARTRDDALHALGRAVLRGESGPTVASVAARLATSPTWVCLDNAEQVAAPVAALAAELLHACPPLRCLVTSRERLRIDGEVVYQVSALDWHDAVALFVARAADATGSVALDVDEARVRRIVGRVDRIPLAIELAAGQLRVLTLRELELRLEQGLQVLSGPRRDAPDRHATMRATLDWSWDLLDEEGRDAVTTLSVFEASFPMAAAESLLEAEHALDLVRDLCDRSWLGRVVHDGASHLQMLHAVRELAREHLARRPDREGVHRRHARWVLAEVERSLTGGASPSGLGGAASLARDLRVLAERGEDAKVATRAAIAFARLAVHRGPVPLALGLLDTVQEAEISEPALRWRLDHVRAQLLLRDGRTEAARAALEPCLARPIDEAARAEALATRASLDRTRGALDEAEAAYREALEIAAGRDDASSRARTLGELGALQYERGELEEAEALLRRALAAHRACGEPLLEAVVRSNLGLVLRERGRLDEAERCFEEALQAHRAAANQRFVGIARADLAALSFERGAHRAARCHAEAALVDLRAAGDRRQLALTRALLGAVQAASGALAAARVTLDEAQAALAALGDAPYAAAARAHRGHLHLAHALGAVAADDAPAAAAAMARARACAPTSEPTDEVRHAARTLAAAIGRAEALEDALLVASDGSWLRGPGLRRADISGRRTLRAILEALVRRRQTSPADPLATEALQAAGWPDERMAARAGANRVRVALSELRKLGLGEILRRDPHGYYLDPDVPLVLAPAQDAD